MKKLLRTAVKQRLEPLQRMMTALVLGDRETLKQIAEKGLVKHGSTVTELEKVLMRQFYDEGSPRHPSRLEGRLTRPYHQSAWVYACNKVLDHNVAQVPYYHKYKSDGRIVTEKDTRYRWLLELFRDVNPLFSASQLWRATVLQLNVSDHGEVMWLYDWGTGLGNAQPGPPKAIWPFPGDLFYPTVGQSKLMGWKFRHPRGFSFIPVRPEEVARFFEYNPYVPEATRGQPAFMAARQSLANGYMAQLYKKFLIGNYAVPVGALLTDKDLTDDQIEQALDNWYEVHSGPETAGDIAILTAGMKFQQFSLSLKGLEAESITKAAREEACAVHLVPPGPLGIMEYANYANLTEQIILMWRQGINPTLKYCQEVAASDFYARFAPELYGEFDINAIPELQQKYSDKLEMALKAWGGGRTWEEVDRMFGLDSHPEEMGEFAKMRFIPQTMIPIGFDLSGGSKAESHIVGAKGRYIIPQTEEMKALPFEAEAKEISFPAPDAIFHARKPKKWTQPVPMSALKRLAEMQVKGGKLAQQAADDVKGWFWELRKKMLNKLFDEAPAFQQAVDTRDLFVCQAQLEIIVMAEKEGLTIEHAGDLPREVQKLIDDLLNYISQDSLLFARIIEPYQKEGMQIGAELTAAELAELGVTAKAFSLTSQRAQAYLMGWRRNAGEIIDRFSIEVRRRLTLGYMEGRSMDKIADSIREYFNGSVAHAMLIARTETQSAISEGKWTSMNDEGVQYKAWMHGAGVKAPRWWHADIEGQVVRIDEPFTLADGSQCMFPKDWDSGLGCENWCNCGCGFYTPTKYADGSDIPLSELFGEEPVM